MSAGDDTPDSLQPEEPAAPETASLSPPEPPASWFSSTVSLLWGTKAIPSSPSTRKLPANEIPTTAQSSPNLPVPLSQQKADLWPKRCECDANGRNLVVCIDGTSNQFSENNTNIVELYHRLVKDPERQITFYNSGIGTYAKPSWTSWTYLRQVLGHKLDLAIAWNFEKIVKSAYRWLAENYRAGDRIFLFGFSRGAYQVRALAAMLDAVGLIHKGNEDQIPFAYQLYAGLDPAQDTVAMKGHFKDTFSREVRVHFVGVWDTVSSVGLVRDKTLPGTTDGMTRVCYFRHALALHERRIKFLPEYINGDRGPDEQDRDPEIHHAKEVWFEGSHSDIGGGNVENKGLKLFGPSLRWMSYEATRFGLLLGTLPAGWNDNSKLTESLTGVWKLFEYLPFRRLSYDGSGGSTRWIHRSQPRLIQNRQKVHVSARECRVEGRATVPSNTSWNDLVEGSSLERDPYTAARHVLEPKDGVLQEDEDIRVLSMLTSTVYGKQALRDIVPTLTSLTTATDRLLGMLVARASQASEATEADSKAAIATARIIVDALHSMGAGYLSSRLRPIAFNLAKEDGRLAEELMVKIGSPALCTSLKGHNGSVACVAFIPSGKVISSSRDGSVRTWEPETGIDQKEPARHSSTVTCVAVHGSRVASCSLDGTFCVWSLETGRVELDHIKAHGGSDGGIQSITFSHDGKLIATGGNDDCAAVWSLDGVLQSTMEDHTDFVLCVAFSHGGGLLVSGSQDLDARVWDVGTGECVCNLVGHSGWVTAVSFDLDDKRIFSSSWDGTLRIWNSTTGEQISKHDAESGLLTLALSNSGKRLVTGSRKGKIELWDAETGAALPAYFPDHTNRVWCVAFSADDRKIVSASEDTTIGLWDATDEWKEYSFR